LKSRIAHASAVLAIAAIKSASIEPGEDEREEERHRSQNKTGRNADQQSDGDANALLNAPGSFRALRHSAPYIGEVCAERPEMSLEIPGVILACAKVGIFRRADDLRARRSCLFEMRLEVVNVHIERWRVAQALVRPHGPEHDDIRAEFQLRVPDEWPRFGDRE